MMQLNTILQHSDYMDINPKVNECYGTPTVQLFERIDDGKLLGKLYNNKNLVCKMYTNISYVDVL